MKVGNGQLPLVALCAALGMGCHGAPAAVHPAAPRVHLAPAPVIKPADATVSTPGDAPDRTRPPCPADENHLDAAAKAYDAHQYDLALACAEDELLEDPESAEAEQQRGLALAALGKIDEARLAMTHALALDPDDPATLAAAADLYLTRGNVTRELEEMALAYARRGERRARRRHPELLEQLDLLQGMALNDLGRFEEALEKLDETLGRDPKDLDARYEHGVALFELCRFAGAKSDLKQVLAELPDDAFSHHELGLALERLGDGQKAQAELSRATALDPDSFPAAVPVGMDEFKHMVDAAVQALPPPMRHDLATVRLSTEEMPDLLDLTVDEPPLSPTILGLFRGEPLDEQAAPRSAPPAAPAAAPNDEPRAILLYRRNLVRIAHDRAELAKQIQITLWHELGHLRGADDDELRLRGLE
jgi:tetratricopeptide (TPR) repeat protein